MPVIRVRSEDEEVLDDYAERAASLGRQLSSLATVVNELSPGEQQAYLDASDVMGDLSRALSMLRDLVRDERQALLPTLDVQIQESFDLIRLTEDVMAHVGLGGDVLMPDGSHPIRHIAAFGQAGTQVVADLVNASRASGLSGAAWTELGVLVNARARSRRILDSAEEAEEAARTASGAASEAELSKHFSALATRETRTGWALRAASVALIAALFSVAVSAARAPGSSEGLTEHWLTHAAYAAPLVILALYGATLASGHLAVARWAEALSVQLLTVDAFTKMFADTDERRATLLADFGGRVFLGGPPVDSKQETMKSPTTELVALTQTVVDLAKTIGPGSGK